MSSTWQTTTDASDADLIREVRAGQLDAYGQLFARHQEAALRLARQLVLGPGADDLVSEGFAKVLTALQNGKGPDEFFRAYLLTSIRRLHIDDLRTAKRVKPTDDESMLDRPVTFVDPVEMKFEQGTAAAAFASLPERWQLVLWHLDVEGHKPAHVAPLLGMSANSVSALAYRAREGLRTAYLQGHLAPPLSDDCRRTTPQLAQHVRKNLSRRDAGHVDQHLDTCTRCSGLYAELLEVNHHLAGLLAPALLGVAASGYLATSGSAAAGGLFAHLTGPFRRPSRSTTAGASAGVVTAVAGLAIAVAAVAAGAVVLAQRSGDDNRAASTPADSVITRAPAPSDSEDDDPADTTIDREAETDPIPAQSEPASTPVIPLASPPPDVTPTPTPTPVKPDVKPTPSPKPTPTRTPAPSPSPTPTPPPTPTPTPTPSGPTATNYSTSVGFVDAPGQNLERRVTVAVAAAGDEPRGNQVTVVMTFNALVGNVVQPDGVTFRGGSIADWTCDAPASGDPLTTMTCTRVQTGITIPSVVFSVHGSNPGVRISTSASDNTDDAAADTTARACSYGNPGNCPSY